MCWLSLVASYCSEYVLASPLTHVLEAGAATMKTLFEQGIYLLKMQSKHILLESYNFLLIIIKQRMEVDT